MGILYEDVLKDMNARGLFKQLRVSGLPLEEETYIVFHKERPLSPSGEAFLKVLREWCEAKEPRQKTSKLILLCRSCVYCTQLMNCCPPCRSALCSSVTE